MASFSSIPFSSSQKPVGEPLTFRSEQGSCTSLLFQTEEGGVRIKGKVTISKSSGFGTEAYRFRMTEGFKRSEDGKNFSFQLHAVASSHIFHLKMGMIPIDTVTPLLDLHTSTQPSPPLQRFVNPETRSLFSKAECRQIVSEIRRFTLQETLSALQSGTTLSEEEKRDIKDYKIKLALPHSLLDEGVAEKISDQELIDRKEELLTKTISLLDVHVYRLIRAIQTAEPGKRPSTLSLGIVKMKMPPEGIARWKEAVKSKKAFESFRNFEQLHNALSPELKETLCTALIEARARGVSV